ncbi:MAG: hypothetical protein ACI9MF_001598, partial [Gammaproteobacteria bacterium]
MNNIACKTKGQTLTRDRQAVVVFGLSSPGYDILRAMNSRPAPD